MSRLKKMLFGSLLYITESNCINNILSFLLLIPFLIVDLSYIEHLNMWQPQSRSTLYKSPLVVYSPILANITNWKFSPDIFLYHGRLFFFFPLYMYECVCVFFFASASFFFRYFIRWLGLRQLHPEVKSEIKRIYRVTDAPLEECGHQSPRRLLFVFAMVQICLCYCVSADYP